MNKLASEIAGEEEGWAFVNVNVRPYYAEGSKTLAYEIAEQLGWRLPDQIVIPVASGSQLTKIDKGFSELIELGLVEDEAVHDLRRPGHRLLAGVAQAFRAGHDVVAPGEARHASPSRWRSATRRTARTCWTSSGAPAGRSRTSTTRQWWRTSSGWPGPRASSPRPPAG